MAFIDDLKTARDTLASTIKDNIHKPNYSINGQSVDWGEMLSRLRMLNEQIAAGEPFEEIFQGEP